MQIYHVIFIIAGTVFGGWTIMWCVLRVRRGSGLPPSSPS